MEIVTRRFHEYSDDENVIFTAPNPGLLIVRHISICVTTGVTAALLVRDSGDSLLARIWYGVLLDTGTTVDLQDLFIPLVDGNKLTLDLFATCNIDLTATAVIEESELAHFVGNKLLSTSWQNIITSVAGQERLVRLVTMANGSSGSAPWIQLRVVDSGDSLVMYLPSKRLDARKYHHWPTQVVIAGGNKLQARLNFAGSFYYVSALGATIVEPET